MPVCRCRCSPSSRGGFTRIEVLVLLILAGIAALYLTARTLQWRELARRAECLDRLQRLGQGVANSADAHDDALPYLADDRQGWPVSLLPYLGPPERPPHVADRRWGAQAAVVPAAGEQRPASLDAVFVCPADFQRRDGRQPLSYVANAGYGRFPVIDGLVVKIGRHSAEIDWNGDGRVTEQERAIARATGVFWRPAPDDFRMTRAYIREGDGLATTLLLSENVQAGTWTARDTLEIAFVIGRETLPFQAPHSDGPRALALRPPVTLGLFAPNAALHVGVPGHAPAPSAWHGGLVNVILCDGRGHSLNQQIDPGLYARLLTPAGTRYGQRAVFADEF